MKIRQFLVHIFVLRLLGFRVMAFEINPAVLMDGDPKLLKKALNEFMRHVARDSSQAKVAGAYGISLGSFFALNAGTLPNIRKVFLNTGGGSIVRAVWDMEVLRPIKRGFEKNGYDRKAMKKHWNPIDMSQNIERLAGKEVLANASYADEYIPIYDVMPLVKEWQAKGIKTRLYLSRRLNHKWLVIRTLCRVLVTARFFRGGVY